jgi:hypothetical protein
MFWRTNTTSRAKKKAMLEASPNPSEFVSDNRRMHRRCDETLSQNGAHRLENLPVFFIFRQKNRL